MKSVEKTKLKTHMFSRALIKLKQNKPILHCGWQPSQSKSCFVKYVCPLDKLIRLSPQSCFILDEFLIILPRKSTVISQANTICIPHIYLLDKLQVQQIICLVVRHQAFRHLLHYLLFCAGQQDYKATQASTLFELMWDIWERYVVKQSKMPNSANLLY